MNMDLEKKIEKLNSKKIMKNLEQNFRERYTFLSFLYYTKLNELNLIKNPNIDFYYKVIEMFEVLDGSLKAFNTKLTKSLEINKNNWEKDFFKITTFKNENFLKLKNHLEKENILIKQYIKKVKTFSKVLYSSICFVQKELVEQNLAFSTNSNFNCIVTYATSVKNLEQEIKASKIKIAEELEFLFKSLDYIPLNDKSFVILSTKQLKSLKKINEKLNNPVNFPVWERQKSKDINFKDGKGFGVFEEFTETY